MGHLANFQKFNLILEDEKNQLNQAPANVKSEPSTNTDKNISPDLQNKINQWNSTFTQLKLKKVDNVPGPRDEKNKFVSAYVAPIILGGNLLQDSIVYKFYRPIAVKNGKIQPSGVNFVDKLLNTVNTYLTKYAKDKSSFNMVIIDHPTKINPVTGDTRFVGRYIIDKSMSQNLSSKSPEQIILQPFNGVSIELLNFIK